MYGRILCKKILGFDFLIVDHLKTLYKMLDSVKNCLAGAQGILKL